MRFYGVMADFYTGRYSGTKQAVVSRTCKTKPNNQYREMYGKTAFVIWLESEDRAYELCEGVQSGDIGIDTMIGIYKSLLPEKKAA